MLRTVFTSITSLGASVLFASQAYAQGRGWFNFFPSEITTVGGGSLENLIAVIIRVALLLAGVVAVIYLIIGGYQYITSGGNAEQAQAGRTTVLNAIIGLVIIFAAFLVINFVMNRIISARP